MPSMPASRWPRGRREGYSPACRSANWWPYAPPPEKISPSTSTRSAGVLDRTPGGNRGIVRKHDRGPAGRRRERRLVKGKRAARVGSCELGRPGCGPSPAAAGSSAGGPAAEPQRVAAPRPSSPPQPAPTRARGRDEKRKQVLICVPQAQASFVSASIGSVMPRLRPS